VMVESMRSTICGVDFADALHELNKKTSCAGGGEDSRGGGRGSQLIDLHELLPGIFCAVTKNPIVYWAEAFRGRLRGGFAAVG